MFLELTNNIKHRKRNGRLRSQWLDRGRLEENRKRWSSEGGIGRSQRVHKNKLSFEN